MQDCTTALVLLVIREKSVKLMSMTAPAIRARMEQLAPMGSIRTPASVLQGGRETIAMKTSSIALQACAILEAAKRASIPTRAIVLALDFQVITVRFRTPTLRRSLPVPCHLLNPASPTIASPIRVNMVEFAWTWRMIICATARLVGVARTAASIPMTATLSPA